MWTSQAVPPYRLLKTSPLLPVSTACRRQRPEGLRGAFAKKQLSLSNDERAAHGRGGDGRFDRNEAERPPCGRARRDGFEGTLIVSRGGTEAQKSTGRRSSTDEYEPCASNRGLYWYRLGSGRRRAQRRRQAGRGRPGNAAGNAWYTRVDGVGVTEKASRVNKTGFPVTFARHLRPRGARPLQTRVST